MMEETVPYLPKRAKLLVAVNEVEHCRIAVRFACAKAKKTGCPVELLNVFDAKDYQGFMGVADKMREERRLDAEKLLEQLAQEAFEWAGIRPSLNVREGLTGEEIIALIEEDQDINMLILGVSPESSHGGHLLEWIIGQLQSKLEIPVLIVPSNLTDQQIHELT